MVRNGYVQPLIAWVDEIHDSFVGSILKMKDSKRDNAAFNCMLEHWFYNPALCLAFMLVIHGLTGVP
jgi:hypothetical protein